MPRAPAPSRSESRLNLLDGPASFVDTWRSFGSDAHDVLPWCSSPQQITSKNHPPIAFASNLSLDAPHFRAATSRNAFVNVSRPAAHHSEGPSDFRKVSSSWIYGPSLIWSSHSICRTNP